MEFIAVTIYFCTGVSCVDFSSIVLDKLGNICCMFRRLCYRLGLPFSLLLLVSTHIVTNHTLVMQKFFIQKH
jgi:hypothetical protein